MLQHTGVLQRGVPARETHSVQQRLALYSYRRMISLIEGKAKWRHLRKLTCKGTLRQVFICLRPKLCIHAYSILIHTRKGGEGRDKVGVATIHKKLGRKYQHD